MSSAILSQSAGLNVYQSVYHIARLEWPLNVPLLWYTLTLCAHNTHTIECTTPVVYLDFMHIRRHTHTFAHTHTHTHTYTHTPMHTLHTNYCHTRSP